MYKVYIKNINDYNIEIALNSLSDNILSRLDKYKVEEKKNQSIIAYYLLDKFLFDDFNIKLVNVKENEYGKPYIDGIYFNISHSKNMIAIIISDLPCGIDIEVLNTKNLRLFNKILNDDEKLLINDYNENDKLEYIMKKWVSIEAISKMIGKNFNLDLNVNIDSDVIIDSKTNDIYYWSKCIKKM